MRKKTIVICPVIAATLAFGIAPIVALGFGDKNDNAVQSETQWQYVNNNGIAMSKNQYDLLRSIGFVQYEIDEMTKQKFDRFMSMDFISPQMYSDNGIYVSGSGERSDVAENQDDNNNGDYDRRYFAEDGSKKLDTFVSIIKEERGYRLFVKQNVSWNVVPNDRYNDIIYIGYTDNLIVVGNDYDASPNVTMSMRYDTTKILSDGRIEEYSTDLTYKSRDRRFLHELGTSVAFRVDFPGDTANGGVIELHSNFFATMESFFFPKFSDVTGVELQSLYAHQKRFGDTDDGIFSWQDPLNAKDMMGISLYDRGVNSFIGISFNDEWLSQN